MGPHFKLDANFKLMSDDEGQEAALLLREMLARLSIDGVAVLSPKRKPEPHAVVGRYFRDGSKSDLICRSIAGRRAAVVGSRPHGGFPAWRF